MKFPVIQLIILFNFTLSFVDGQTLKPILKLDDSKSYELYIITTDFYKPEKEIIKEVIKTDTLNQSNFEKGFNSSNRGDTLFSKIYQSKKSGIRIWISNESSYCIINHDIIRNIGKEWVGMYTSNRNCGCQSDYLVYVIESGKIVDKFYIVHGNVVLETGIIGTSVRPFDKLDKSNKFYIAEIQFPSQEKAKSFIEDARKTDGIFVNSLQYNDWMNYDGSFCLKFNNGGNRIIIDKLRNEMKRKYPQEKFDVSLDEYWEGHYCVARIYCNKTLADAFAPYKIYRKWEPLNIDHTDVILDDKTLITVLIKTEIFFKDLSQIKGLIDKYIND